MPSSSREPLNHGSGHENGGVVSEKDNSMRKKRPSRRHTPEPGSSQRIFVILYVVFFSFANEKIARRDTF